MKKAAKILAMILALVMLFPFMGACGTSKDTGGSGAGDTSGSGEVYTLVFSFTDPDTNNQYTDIFKPYFDRITEETDGRVRFECHFNGELVGLGEAYDAVANGTVDIAYIRSGSLSYCPFEALLENPPITGQSCTRSSYVMNQLYSEYPELADCYKGVKFLLRYQMYYGYIGTTSKPIESMADLRGKTMIVGSALAADRLTAYGGTPLDVLPPDFYTSLEKGLADGALTVTQPEMISYSWSGVIKYVTLVPIIKACCGLAINPDTWNSLPQDIRDIIDGIQADIIDMADEAMNRVGGDAVETLKSDYDTTFIEPGDAFIADLKAADESAIQAYIAELEAGGLARASEIYSRYLELYNQYSE